MPHVTPCNNPDPLPHIPASIGRTAATELFTSPPATSMPWQPNGCRHHHLRPESQLTACLHMRQSSCHQACHGNQDTSRHPPAIMPTAGIRQPSCQHQACLPAGRPPACVAPAIRPFFHAAISQYGTIPSMPVASHCASNRAGNQLQDKPGKKRVP